MVGTKTSIVGLCSVAVRDIEPTPCYNIRIEFKYVLKHQSKYCNIVVCILTTTLCKPLLVFLEIVNSFEPKFSVIFGAK